jgi:hypothetical protein
MLSYLLLSSASFALPIPFLIKGKCVDVTGHETNLPETRLDAPTEVTAKFCRRGNGLSISLNKPSDLAMGGLIFQTPGRARSSMKCKRFLGLVGRNVCRIRFNTATDGDYEMQYEANGHRKVILFSFTSPVDDRREPERRELEPDGAAGAGVIVHHNGLGAGVHDNRPRVGFGLGGRGHHDNRPRVGFGLGLLFRT